MFLFWWLLFRLSLVQPITRQLAILKLIPFNHLALPILSGLVWNCRLGVCARTSECPPALAKCQAYGCPATSAPWVNKQPSMWKIPTPVQFPYGMTKQQCICREALKFSSASSARVCDPYAENKYLECMRDRTVIARSCAAGTKWNYLAGTCSHSHLCRPVPAVCKGM